MTKINYDGMNTFLLDKGYAFFDFVGQQLAKKIYNRMISSIDIYTLYNEYLDKVIYINEDFDTIGDLF